MPTLALITLTAPLWLAAGCAAAALPIVAHLIRRKRGPTVVFPAARLARIAQARSAGRSRPRDAALLAVRLLIVGVVALAFARPRAVIGALAGERRAGVDLVIVIDASASMTRVNGGRTLFERACAEAAGLIESLDAETDRAGVIFAGMAPRAALPALTANMAALLGDVGAALPTLARGDLRAALEAASALPATGADVGRSAERRIVVVSDLQRTTWATLLDASEPITPGGEVVDVGPGRDGVNVGLAGARASAGSGVEIDAFAPAAPGEARSLIVEGPGVEAVATAPLALRAGERATARVDAALSPQGGAVRVSLDGADDLAADDALEFDTGVAETLRVAIVSRGPGEPRSGARFLRAALESIGADAGPGVEVRVLPPDRIGDADDDVLALVDAGELGEPELEAVRARLREGGAVLWTLDSPGSVEALRRCAPAVRVGAPLASEPAERAAAWWVELDGAAERSLADVSFGLIAPGEADERMRIAARFRSGRPLVLTSTDPALRLTTVHASLDLDDSDLARSPLFPALAHQLVRLAAATSGERPRCFVVGETILLPLPPRAGARAPLKDALGRPVAIVDGRLHVAPAAAPGCVRVIDREGRAIAAATVRLDESESDLRMISLSEARRGLSGADAPGASADLARPRSVELWPAALALALALCSAESLLASRGPARGGAP